MEVGWRAGCESLGGLVGFVPAVEGQKCSRGYQVIEWLEEFACHGPGDVEGEPLDFRSDPEVEQFIIDCFKEGYVDTDGTRIVSMLPPVSRFAPSNAYELMKSRVVERFRQYFDRFVGM